MKRTVLFAVLLLGLAMVLVACGGAEYECTDEIGCVTYGPDDPIRIASSLVISGPNTELGLDSQHGVEIAIDFRGQILGHDVELQAEDDGCNAEGGQTSATKITSDPTIIAIVGTSCSGAGVPASAIAAAAGYPMVSPSNTAPSLTDPETHESTYMRTAHNDKVQGRAMAQFAIEELGVTTAAAIHDGDPYTEGLARVFADSFEEMGGTIVAFEAVGPNDTDMKPVLTKISAAGPPEFLYYPVFIAAGAFITTQAKEVAGLEETILAGADGMQSPSFLENAGEAAQGMYLSGPDLGFGNDLYNRFLSTYQEKYGTEPTAPFHAHAYDAAWIIFDAIEKVAVQDDDGTLHIGRKALVDELLSTSGFEGITGTITCDEYGDCADPKISVSQVEGSDFVPVWP